MTAFTSPPQLPHQYTVYRVTRFISLVQKCSISGVDVLVVAAGDAFDFSWWSTL